MACMMHADECLQAVCSQLCMHHMSCRLSKRVQGVVQARQGT